MGIEVYNPNTVPSVETDDNDNTEVFNPIGNQDKIVQNIEKTTTSEDARDVADIAQGLLRSFGKQAAETGGTPSLVNQNQLRRRSEDIEQAVERLPGEENTLGLARTTFSIGKFFVDNIVGVANTIAVPLGLDSGTVATETLLTKPQKTYDKEKYVKYYTKLRKKDNWFESYLSTAYKVFKDSPELKNEGEFVKGVIDRLAGQAGTISAREADEITAYWRPEASLAEQAVRAVPEIVGGTAAGIKFLTRGSKKVVARAEKIMGKDILQATDDDIREATLKMMNDATFSLASYLGLSGMRRAMYGKRVGSVLTMKQKPIYKTLVKNNAAISSAKEKLSLAKSSKDKALIARESAALSVARSNRVNSIPKELLEIPATEVGAVLGATIGGNMYGEDFGALFGALGGGFGSSIAFTSMYKFASGAGKGVGSLIVSLGSFVGALNDDQVRALAQKGIIPKISNLTKQEQKAMNDFATFIRALPQEDREGVYSQLKLLNDIRVDLGAAGVDPELLEVTMGKATGIIPLMMMRDAITSSYNKLDMAKGIKGIDKNLEILLGNERNIEKQFEELRGLVDQLAGAAGDAGVQNSRFNSFVKSMQTVSARQTEQLGQDRQQIDGLVQEILDLVADPMVTKSIEDKETLTRLIEQLMKARLLDDVTYPKDEAGRILKEGAIPNLGRVASRQIDTADQAATEVETNLVGFLNAYLNPKKYQLNAEEAANNLAQYARNIKADITAKANARFEALSQYGDAIDITDWLDDLYGTADDVIARTRKARIQQVLMGKKLNNAARLEAFSNEEGQTSVIKALESSPELKDAIVTEFKQSLRDAGETEDAIAAIEDLNYSQIKTFFNEQYKGEVGDELNDFDVFKIAKIMSEELGLPDLKITATVSDIQFYSSEFSRKAKQISNRELSMKMNNLSRTIINQVPEDGPAGIAIRDAKKNYIDNVIVRYRDIDGNPIGYNVDHYNTNTKSYKVDPVKWIDMDKIVSGDSQVGADVVNHIKKTFGTFSEEKGTYELIGEDITIVRNLMNDLLARNIVDSKTMLDAGDLIPSQGKLGDAEKLVEGRLAARARSVGGKFIRSPALRRLEEEGLIDLDRVVQYNIAVDTFFGGKEILKNAEGVVEKEVKRAADAVSRQVSLRENFLKNMGKFGAEQQGASEVNDYDRFLRFFILNPQGQSRMDDLFPKIAKEMGVDEKEVKELVSDLTIESISRASYGRMREAREGQMLRDFDHESLYSLVLDKDVSERVRGVIGDDKFTALTRMAQFLMVQNRDNAARLKDAGISVTAPKGLSIESLLSRTYSVARGVISPKYVATEVALLSFRKKKAQALSRILNDPKMVDVVIDIIETEGDTIRKYDPNLFTALINGLGYHENMKTKENTKTQIRELELDNLRR